MIPLSNVLLVLFFIASAFAALEHPSYQALIADLTDPSERERAYSLSYLGTNLGLVLAPTIGGFLFENHLNFSFVIASLATLTLKEVLGKACAWWGTDNKEIYDNVIFVMPVATAKGIAEKIGEPTKELEQLFICDNVIFWSFDRTKYSKANWWKKTAGADIGELLTIRTGST